MNDRQNILLVEDAPEIQMLVESALAPLRANLIAVSTRAAALRAASKTRFDLVLLDIHLPDADGFEVLTGLQGLPGWKETPAVFLTARNEIADKVAAFSLGADDYIVKPFHLLEFRARIEARLRNVRSRRQAGSEVVREELRFDLESQRVYLAPPAGGAGRPVDLALTPIEFRLFLSLARHPDRVFSRDQLLNSVWGENVHITDRTVDAHVCSLRRKLKDRANRIESVPGVGYRYTETKREPQESV